MLRWFFRLESLLAFGMGAVLLGFGGFLVVGIWTGGVELALGSDLPTGALYAMAIGTGTLAFGYLCHRAALSLRDSKQLEQPSTSFAASIACHIAVLMGVGAAIAL